MATLTHPPTQSPTDRPRRTLPALTHPRQLHHARTTSVWFLSAVFVAFCGGDFTPPPTTVFAVPTAAASATTRSALCTPAASVRRGQWNAAADASAPRATIQPEVAMSALPAQIAPVCGAFDRDMPAETRLEWRTIHPTLTLQANKSTPWTMTTQTWTSGGGGGGGYIAGGEPCTGSRAIVWTITVWQWVAPPGCFGGIFTVNPYAYGVETSDYGWCAWWPIALTHNNNALNLPRHSTPIVGAVMWFAPGNQGAGSDGHWAYVESIGPNGWLLISEMNDDWRGGGWAKINYRYVRVTSGNAFLY